MREVFVEMLLKVESNETHLKEISLSDSFIITDFYYYKRTNFFQFVPLDVLSFKWK